MAVKCYPKNYAKPECSVEDDSYCEFGEIILVNEEKDSVTGVVEGAVLMRYKDTDAKDGDGGNFGSICDDTFKDHES